MNGHIFCMSVLIPLANDRIRYRAGKIVYEDCIHTSKRCRTLFTNMLPSAAKPFTARTALSVLPNNEDKTSRMNKREC